MPYPNEHAARIRDPGVFDINSFRSKDLKNGIRIIVGKLKGGTTMVVQTYRFSIDKFTTEQAKKWLEDNKVRYIKFESAQSESGIGESVDNELKHVGVMGMKWGVRNRRDMPGKTSGKKARNLSEDHKITAAIKAKHLSEMSNDDIEKISKRIQLEKRYKDLNPNKVAKGKRTVDSVFAGIGKVSAVTASVIALVAVGKPIFEKLVKMSKKA